MAFDLRPSKQNNVSDCQHTGTLLDVLGRNDSSRAKVRYLVVRVQTRYFSLAKMLLSSMRLFEALLEIAAINSLDFNAKV